MPASSTSVPLSFPPTEPPWGSFHATILHCQAPNPLSGLFHKVTAFWIPAKWSQLGFGYLEPARSSQLPPCTSGQMFHSHCPHHLCDHERPLTPLSDQGWAIPILSNLCSFHSHEQLHWQILGRIWGILVMRSLQRTTAARAGCVFKTSSILLSPPSVQLMK